MSPQMSAEMSCASGDGGFEDAGKRSPRMPSDMSCPTYLFWRAVFSSGVNLMVIFSVRCGRESCFSEGSRGGASSPLPGLTSDAFTCPTCVLAGRGSKDVSEGANLGF